MKKNYYNKIYEIEDKRWWSVARRTIIKKVIQTFNLNSTIDILELGCGNGGNFELLSEFGNVYAMDSNDIALQMAIKRQIGQVASGCLPLTIPFGSRQFDLIVLLDVLEHIDDEKLTLRTIHDRLKDNGRILLTVPAYNLLWSRIDIDSHHKRRYIKSGLTKLLSDAGFFIDYSTYYNTFLFPIIALIRIINKTRGKQDNLDVKMHSDPINQLLTMIFASEKKLIPKISMPFGVSILATAIKIR